MVDLPHEVNVPFLFVMEIAAFFPLLYAIFLFLVDSPIGRWFMEGAVVSKVIQSSL